MKAIIVTEGSKKIGFGHVTRCMSLYQAFREKNINVQLIVNGDTVIKTILNDTNYKIFNWLKNPDKLIKLIEDSEIIIIDSYLAKEEFYKRISELSGLSIYLDDNKRINYPEGIVINGSILAANFDYPTFKGVRYLLGSQYMPLRREFWNVGQKEIKKYVQTIMVTFGGDDLRNMTSVILKMLNDKYPNIIKNIVIGEGFNNKTEIKKLKNNKINFIYNPDANEMLNLMFKSDLAISAGGQTLYELARVGVPTIAIAVIENQFHNVDSWKNVGFIEFAGFWDNEDLFEKIIRKFEILKERNLRIKKYKNGKKFIDGQGALRIVEYALNMYYDKNVDIRPVISDDMNKIFELSNEEVVRKNSYKTQKIGYETHKKWFKNRIMSEECVFLVGELDGDFVGQVRFDLQKDNAKISISIVEKYRKLGLGSNLLKNSIDYLKKNAPTLKIIKAYIKKNNKISINFFEKNEFKYVKNLKIENQNSFEYAYKIRDVNGI